MVSADKNQQKGIEKEVETTICDTQEMADKIQGNNINLDS